MHRSTLLAFSLLVPMPRAQEVDALIAQLAKAETLDSEGIGDDGMKSDTYKAYERLLALSKPEDLEKLTTHASPIVRGYAVRGLVAMNAQINWKKLVLDHLPDVAEVWTFEGCTKCKRIMGDVIFELVRPKLAAADLAAIAEALVQQQSPLWSRSWALRTIQFGDGMLHQIRELATKGDDEALIALARYHIAKDVPLLSKSLGKGKQLAETNAELMAAAISRSPDLLPALIALRKEAARTAETDSGYRLRFWLEALCAQETAEAAAFLAEFVAGDEVPESRWQDFTQGLKEALIAHPTPLLDPVRQALKARNQRLKGKGK